MDRFHRANYSRIALGLIALIALLALWRLPPVQPLPPLLHSAILALGIVVLSNFPIALRRREVNLAHLISLGGALAHGAFSTAIVAGLAIVLGDLIRFGVPRSPGYRNEPPLARAGLAAFDFGHIVLITLVAGAVYQAMGGPAPAESRLWLPLTGFGLAAIVVYNALLVLDLRWAGEDERKYYSENRASLLLVNVLPVPLAVYSTGSLFVLSLAAGVVQLLLFAAIGVTLHFLSKVWRDSQERIAELNSLNKVSRAMRASLDLNALLDTIYLQTAHLLNISNFYIALYDADNDAVSFPLAIKGGARQKWDSRPATARLTDWIIRNRAPLLVPYDVPGTLNRLGLERGEVEPEAFMGAPLVTSDRALGCMAVLSFTPGETFTPENLEIFTTLTAQAAAAIENAQLYGVTQRRAAELATLTKIATLVSATLDPARVLELVCASVLPLVRGDKAAIFLIAEDEQELYLARSEGLSEVFLSESLTVPLSNTARARAVTTGLPVTVADVRAALARSGGAVPDEIAALAEAEGYRAYAELPLAAQREIIGLLAVYYANPHHFKSDEIELLKTLANQAALAVTNARLYARTDQALARRLAQLSALEAIGRELTANLDLSRVFEVVLARATEATGAAAACLSLYDAETGQTDVPAAKGYPADFVGRLQLRTGSSVPGITGRVQRLGEAALVPDVSLDPDFAPGAAGTRSQLSVPIVRERRVLGVITLESPQVSAFGQEDAKFVSQLAVQAGLAIENARLFQRVAEGRDRLAAVLNSTREGILMVDENGRVALANPLIEEFFGLPRAELIGKSLLALNADPAIELGLKLGYTDVELADLRTSAQKFQLGISAPKPRILERAGLPVTDESGSPVGWLVVFRDVTEEKELERAREDLAGMIVHDLRSPLTAILGSIELMDDLVSPAQQQGVIGQALRVSSRSCKRLLGLVESLLDISKMESGELRLRRRPIHLKPLVHDVVADLAALASDHGVLIVNEVPADIPSLSIDDEKVSRVLTNLIDNALKFTPPGGQILVQAELNGGPLANDQRYILCRVADTGPGIPDEYRERIFERFVQVPGASGRRKGTGLGLAFCKLAVEAHGGRIWASNRPEGGSAFAFTLPVADI